MKLTVDLELDVLPTDAPEMWRGAAAPVLARIMEPEIQEFDRWFQQQSNSPMIGVEKAILRTYLAWKLKS